MKAKKIKIFLLFAVLAVMLCTISVAAILSTSEDGMKFDGLAEYKTGEVAMTLPMTYEATVCFPLDFEGRGGIMFGNCKGDDTPSFNFEIHEGGSPRLYVIDGEKVKYDVIFKNVNVYNGKKTHVAITVDKDAGEWYCYVNGSLSDTVKAAAPAPFDLTSVFAIGGDNTVGNPQYFKGSLFTLSLYADKRTSSEIALDAKGGEIATDGLIAAYAPLAEENVGITAKGDTKYNVTCKSDWITDMPLPDDFAHSFAVIGDIQSMTYYYPDQLVDMFEWIRDNAKEHKIAYSIGLGDVTEKNTKDEYLKVVEAYDKIDGVVPFSIIRGNHDRTSDNSTAMYDTYINKARYGDEITGSYDSTMHNTYRILQVGRVKYMFMNLDFVLSDGAIEWANRIISDHPECHVIVSTHIYKNMGGTWLKLDGGKFGAQNNPEELWNRVISQHENVVMTLYGHSPVSKIYRKQREGVNGNLVTEMLINPSETDKAYGGGGFMAMLYFSEDGEHVDVRYYSVSKDAHYRSDNQFGLNLDTPGTVEFSSVIMNVGASESERNITWYSRSDTPGEIRYAKSVNGTLPEVYSVAKAIPVKTTKSGYYSYKATMSGLEANSIYVYCLAIGDAVSECRSFKTYGMGEELSFAFITDAQLKEAKHAPYWNDTLKKIKEKFADVSFIVSAGDQTSDPASETNFDWFTSEHLTSIAIATTVGPPHDNTQLYKDHYNLPNLSSKYGISTPSSDYFYTYGSVLFMHLNVENHDYDGHIKFIESSIADNPECKWRVVVMHYSFFTGGNHSTDGSVLAFREALAGKFSELDIDVVLSGHDHVYTRSQMMINGNTVSTDAVKNGSVTDPKGTLYICGASSTGSGWYSVEHHNDDAYIAKCEDTNRKSVVIFSVSGNSLTLKSYFIDGYMPEEFDSFTINKTKSTAQESKDTYDIRFVALPGATFGDSTDISAFAQRSFTATEPDAPALYMPKGSLREGKLYDWSWEYYLVGGNGTPVTSFEYGRSYVAYPVASETPIASTIYIGTASVPSEYVYTWREAWDIVLRLAGERITLELKSDVTLTADDAVSVVIPLDLTIDLCGKKLDTSALAVAVKLAVGSNGSYLKIVTSKDGGALNAGANDFIEIGSNQGSSLTVQYGSEDTRPLTVESVKYLVGANGNFKYTSTLNLSVYDGSYTLARGVVYVSNVTTSAGANSPNIYKISLNSAKLNFFGGESAIIRAKSVTYLSNAASYIDAVGCVFTDTYKPEHDSSRFLIREDCWQGTATFTDCDFIGMAIGADYLGAPLSKCGTITVGEGCTFTNSETTFKEGNPLSFFCDKVVTAPDCVIARTDSNGAAEVVSLSDAAEIIWQNPVGYKEYWKLGTTPTYLGADSFTVGDKVYSLVTAETPTPANGNKVYTFVSAEGHPYRYDRQGDVWQISTDGGKTYVNITEPGSIPSPDIPDEPDEPETAPGCTVTVDGVSTYFSADTDFQAVLASVNVPANSGKEISIILSADMTLSTGASYSSAKNSTLNIDVAGHKLTFAANSRFKISNGYTLRIYSSVAGGEFVFGTTGDAIQPGSGVIIFGSEQYKNTLTVSTEREIVNPSQLANGSNLEVKCLYSTVNPGAYGILRINAKGAAAITVKVEIVGCTVNGSSRVIGYNSSSTLGATANGGVCKVDSHMQFTNSVFNCTAETPTGFFGTDNFTDRYFGTASFIGCTFRNYVLNGDLIRSDESLDYNAYYDTLAGTGYDPAKAITVSTNCVFYNYGDTFNEDMSGFGASNVSIAKGCIIVKKSDCAEIVTDPTHNHSYTSTVTAPTCTEGGYTTSVCECGVSYVDGYVDALGHSFGAWSDTTPPTCTQAGEKTRECSVCHGNESKVIDALGHDEIPHGAKAPTCNEIGWDAYVTCSRCSYTTYSHINAYGHDLADATCDTPKTCKVCGATTGEALGHEFTEATDDAPKTCERCGATEGESPDTDVPDHANCDGGFFAKLWNAIVNFFRRLFGMPEICICGKER